MRNAYFLPFSWIKPCTSNLRRVDIKTQQTPSVLTKKAFAMASKVSTNHQCIEFMNYTDDDNYKLISGYWRETFNNSNNKIVMDIIHPIQLMIDFPKPIHKDIRIRILVIDEENSQSIIKTFYVPKYWSIKRLIIRVLNITEEDYKKNPNKHQLWCWWYYVHWYARQGIEFDEWRKGDIKSGWGFIKHSGNVERKIRSRKIYCLSKSVPLQNTKYGHKMLPNDDIYERTHYDGYNWPLEHPVPLLKQEKEDVNRFIMDTYPPSMKLTFFD